uniref:Uncharacterized protein n=1 Tax=Arundo donax TaxID=35708 RepID=A0A0A8ZA32_ARUDO
MRLHDSAPGGLRRGGLRRGSHVT